ncbi:MAG TPA: head-tail connector protein [Terriglobales bacterium]|nr:head-tail connector protein [Terriglobales bacterium]
MYEQIITPRSNPVVLPADLASFGRFDLPEQYTSLSPLVPNSDYTLLQTFIDAASDQVEQLAATAMITETMVLTFDFFPGQADPRQLYNYELGLFNQTPWWWFGFQTQDSIEIVRRPVQSSLSPLVAPVITYNDTTGALQTLDPSTYTVNYNKITLNVGCTWPLTDRRQDCIQITYTAGYGATSDTVPSQLKLAVMFLAAHFYENRSIATVEPTSEIYMTLCSLLSSYRSFRIPR